MKRVWTRRSSAWRGPWRAERSIMGSVAQQAEVQEGLSQVQQTNIRKKTKQLAKQAEDIFMHLGKMLYIVWDKTVDGKKDGVALWEKWGFMAFADYVEDELGMDRRRAQRLKKVWFNLEVDCHGISDTLKANLVECGATKLRELARVMNADNAEYWYNRCKDMNVKDTVATVNAYLDELNAQDTRFQDPEGADSVQEPDPDADPEATFNENFKLYPPQQEILKNAIEGAKHLSGKPNAKKGHCLTIICNDFMKNNDLTFGREDDREKYVAKLEKLLSLRLIAIDPKTGEIIHGLATMEALARREID